MFLSTYLWQKVAADLFIHKSRTALAITSIAIGAFIIGTLLGMMDLQLSQMDSAHRQSQPSHISLILRQDADNALADTLRHVEGVADIDVLTPFTVQYKLPHSEQWQTGTALFRPDYATQRYDRMTLVSGAFPSSQAIAAERLSAQAAGLHSGDKIAFATATGTQDFMLNGIIRHPFVKPPAFGGQLYFFLAPELGPLFGIPAHTFRQVMVQIQAPYSIEKARTVAAQLRATLAAHGIAVNATLLQDPEQHWGRGIFSGIHLVLTVMAWASLLLSSVLILNTVAALITQQTEQIGIMKAIGARRWTIAKIYLAQVLILALCALAIALPLSWAGAFYSSRWLLGLFNISLDGFAYSPRALGLTLAGGLLAPLAAALWPVWRGAALPVRQALASYGLGADFVGTGGLARRLEAWATRWLPTLYAVALANLLRRKARLLWTQSVLTIAGVLFIVIMSLAASVNLTLDKELARSRYTLRLGFSQDQEAATVTDIVHRLSPASPVEFWNRLPAEFSRNGVLLRQSGSLGVQMLALPTNTTLYQPLITAGRWFNASDEQQNHLVLNAATAELNGIQVGDWVQGTLLPPAINGKVAPAQDWQVIGLYRWFAGAGYTVEPVYAPLSTIQAQTHTSQRHSFALWATDIKDLAAETAYADTVKAAFRQAQIKLDVYTTFAKLEQRQFAQNQFRPMTAMLLGLAVLIAAVGAIGLSGTLAIGVLQRTREIGVLRAIGAKSSAIFKLFMLEGLCHGVLAWLLSIPLAYLLAEPLAKQLGITMLGIHLDFVFAWPAVALWLGAVLLLAVVAAYLPARTATRIVVRESLNY